MSTNRKQQQQIMLILKENDKQTKAYLRGVKGVVSKENIRSFYRFEINNNIYVGFYDNYKEHDSIDIIYL